MILKNYLKSGVMILKKGGAMILKKSWLWWGHVSEKSHPAARFQGGEVFVIPGAPDLAPQIDLAKGGWDLRVLGADEWDWMGGRIAVSDLNIDGRGELILSSWAAAGPDNLRTAAGETVILYCTPCVQPGIDAGPDKTSCEGMPVTLMSAVTCLPGCPVTDYRFRWIDNSTGLPACDWNSLPSCTVTLSQDTTFTAEAMCSSNPGTVLQDQMSISVLPDPIPVAVGNSLRAVKEGSTDIRFTWLDLTMPTGGYELVILPSPAGPPTPANMDGADVVHNEVIPPGDQFQIHVGGLQLAPALNFYKIRAISQCTHTRGPTGN